MDTDDVLQKPAEPYEAAGRLDPAGFDRNVVFRTYAPPEDLLPFIVHFWVIRWSRRDQPPYLSEQVMHKPYVDAYVSGSGSGIQCTFRGSRTYVAAGEGRIVGARFLPGAFHAFWKGSMAGWSDKTMELARVFPAGDAAFVERLLADDDNHAVQQLASLIQSSHPAWDSNIALVNQIIDAVERDESLQTVAAIAGEFLRSERWIQSLFSEYVGVGIKWFLKRGRLLKAAQSIRDQTWTNWAALAYDLGYSSQQHFITDFKRALGKTPVQYQREVVRNPRTDTE